MAANAPGPIDFKKIHEGVNRTEVISILGIPKLSDYTNHQKVDRFEFKNGFDQASKARILLYLAGDLFSAGLGEFVFWPIEANALDGEQCWGSVRYDSNDHVVSYEILNSEKKPIWTPTTTSAPDNSQ